MLIPLKSWLLFILLVSVAFCGIWYRMYGQFPLPTSDDDDVRMELARRWAQKVSVEVRRLPGRPSVAVARVVNDTDGILTAQLKCWIGRRNVRLMNGHWYSDVVHSAGVVSEPSSLAEAILPLIGEVDYIIAAEVSNWTTYPEFDARLVGHVRIHDGTDGRSIQTYELSLPEVVSVVDAATRRDVPRAEADEPIRVSERKVTPEEQLAADSQSIVRSRPAGSLPQRPIIPAVSATAGIGDIIGGFSFWCLILVLLPWSGARGISRVLTSECNWSNGLLLLTWAILTGALAVLLWVRYLPAPLHVMSGAMAVLAAVVWFGLCCRALSRGWHQH